MEIRSGTRFDHYEISAPLGAGGMGEVYLARDTRLERKVALKLLPQEFTQHSDRLRRFEQEAKAASALNHPNIITIYEIGAAATEQGSVHFIATEFIEGQTVRQQIAGARLKLGAALDLATQVASALAAAHAAGIVHRDIKPENVMMRPDGLVKVLDFGLAKLTERRVTALDTKAPTVIKVNTDPGVVLGTVQYMSPEQARGLEVDARSDIFSLGVLLYEMITGRAPFTGATTSDLLVALLDKEPAPLRLSAPNSAEAAVPAELQRIVTKALRKDREERYQVVKEMLLDLKSLKQELEFAAKLKGGAFVVPPSGGSVREQAIPPEGGTTNAQKADPATNEVSAARTTSSAEYIVSEIKRHRLAAFIALLILLVAATGLGLYLHAKNTEVAIDSIAVLPFANQNRAEETDYLADGLTESIINNLTQLADLRVIARSSAFRYKGKEDDPFGAGESLGVRAVVVGRVLQRGEHLMVSAELVDVRENKQLWGQQYNNRKLSDIFAMQGEIAKEISEKLRLKLTGAERQQMTKRPTENLKAFQYYTQGRAYAQRRTREDLLTAIRYCEKAIEEDHNYALAYAGLAEAYSALGVRGYIAPQEGRRQAEEAARQALALDDDLAETHVAMSQVGVLFAPFDFSLVDRELRRAVKLSPSFALAHTYLGLSFVRQGRFDESSAEYRKARELDPLSPHLARAASIPIFFKRDYTRALELLRQTHELGPAFILPFEIGLYVQNGLFDEALAELEKAKRTRKNDPILIYSTGVVYAAQGKRAQALQVIKELEAMSGASLSQAHWIAKIYAALHEKELAFGWLEHGLAAGAIEDFFKDEPVWDTLRSGARFGDLLRRMGVPQ